MLDTLYDKLNIASPVAMVIISVALMLFSGFAMTRITKKLRLPNVTGYILAGILLCCGTILLRDHIVRKGK